MGDAIFHKWADCGDLGLLVLLKEDLVQLAVQRVFACRGAAVRGARMCRQMFQKSVAVVIKVIRYMTLSLGVAGVDLAYTCTVHSTSRPDTDHLRC